MLNNVNRVRSITESLILTQTNTLAGITNKTFVAPVLGAATATSINGITITVGTGTMTLNNKILALNGNISTSSAGYISTGGGGVTGGYIDTSDSGGSIDTGGSGGNIHTRDGGGSISTEGNGSIGLGIAANRITLQGTAGSNGKFATLPNVTGTVVVASVIPTTLGSGATTLAVASRVVKLTGHASGNTIATITGGISGMSLVIIFVDALVTITDTDAPTANTVNLSAAFTSSANDTLSLVYDGTKWFETARSVN